MVASLNCFLKIEGATGESKQKNFEGQVELQAWEWEAEAESSWTKGSGASVGKAIPGKMSWEHYYDTASPTILRFIIGGKAFASMTLQMCKSVGGEQPEPYFIATMEGCMITKVNQSATDEGAVSQKVEMVFKTIKINYRPQTDAKGGGMGGLGSQYEMFWDISKGSWG